MKIINCDDEVIAQIPNIMNFVYEAFGEQDVAVFATLEDNKLGFIIRAGENCMFINYKGEQTYFSLNENEDLYAVGKDEYTVVFDSVLCFVNKDQESSLDLVQLSEPDEDDYTGMVRFLQHDRKTNTMCEINYQQMYREYNGQAPIYSFHTEKIDRAYITEDYDKQKDKTGLLSRKCHYFSKVVFKEGHIGYDISAIKDYGLFEFLSKGSYNLIREPEVEKYTKAIVRCSNGTLFDPWPFGREYSEKDVKEIIESHGFKSEIPEEYLRIYNGGDSTVQMAKELVRLMKELKPELEKPENSRMCLLLSMEK